MSPPGAAGLSSAEKALIVNWISIARSISALLVRQGSPWLRKRRGKGMAIG
jgi:hypothetical protein